MVEPSFSDVSLGAFVKIYLKSEMYVNVNKNKNITGGYVLRKKRIAKDSISSGISEIIGRYEGMPCNRRGPKGEILSMRKANEHSVLLTWHYADSFFDVSVPLKEIKSREILKPNYSLEELAQEAKKS